MTALTKLTSEEVRELTSLLRQQMDAEARVGEIERQKEALKDTEERLLEVVRTFVPQEKGAKVVVEALEEWLTAARQAKQEALEAERLELTGGTVDTPVVVDAPQESLWNPTNWLLLALTGLQLGSIILLLSR